jgi:hypothetical protein
MSVLPSRVPFHFIACLLGEIVPALRSSLRRVLPSVSLPSSVDRVTGSAVPLDELASLMILAENEAELSSLTLLVCPAGKRD